MLVVVPDILMYNIVKHTHTAMYDVLTKVHNQAL